MRPVKACAASLNKQMKSLTVDAKKRTPDAWDPTVLCFPGVDSAEKELSVFVC